MHEKSTCSSSYGAIRKVHDHELPMAPLGPHEACGPDVRWVSGWSVVGWWWVEGWKWMVAASQCEVISIALKDPQRLHRHRGGTRPFSKADRPGQCPSR